MLIGFFLAFGPYSKASTSSLTDLSGEGLGNRPLASVHADEQSSEHRVFLPIALAPAPLVPEACALLAPQTPPCSSMEDGGWVLACGGFGRITDMVSLNPGDAPSTILAIGDGVARYNETPERITWTGQLGQATVGLNAITALDRGFEDSPNAGAVSYRAWAVGDQAQILETDDQGCWPEDQPSYFDAGLNYRAVRVLPVGLGAQRIGWVAGERFHPNRETRQAALVDFDNNMGVWKPWSDASLSQMPPLTNVEIVPGIPGSEEVLSWMAGGTRDGRDGAIFRKLDTGNSIDPSIAPSRMQAFANGINAPRDLLVSRNLGIAIGETFVDGQPNSSMGWQTELGDDLRWGRWIQHQDFRQDFHRPLDAYRISDEFGPYEFWVSHTSTLDPSHRLVIYPWGPEPKPKAVHTLTAAAESRPVERLDSTRGAISPIEERAGEDAKAMIFATGDEVWRLDLEAANALPGQAGAGNGSTDEEEAAEAWTRARQRHDFIDIAHHPDGTLMLGDAFGGSRVFVYHRDRHQLAGDAELEAALAEAELPPLTGVARHSNGYWFVGEEGTSVRTAGPLGRARIFQLPPRDEAEGGVDEQGGDARSFTDIVVFPGSFPEGTDEVWATSVERIGDGERSQLWRFDAVEQAWQAQFESGLDGSLVAVDGNSAGVYAVGDGLVAWAERACPRLEEPAAGGPDCECRNGNPAFPWACIIDDPVMEDGQPLPALVDVAAPPSAGMPFAVGEDQLIRIRSAQTPAFVAEPSPIAQPSFPTGFKFTHVAAPSSTEAWVIATCGRGGWKNLPEDDMDRMNTIVCGDDAPFYSNLMRFADQDWSPLPTENRGRTQATRANVALHDLMVGKRDGMQEIWAAGDWMTVAYRRDPLR